ncbi:peptide ABC transporter permease [Bacillus sp. M6-12]|uniref:ABC transporter permease n=1 Tax=Bacillus sp. M6-12 TaxID=2054166 RepID=UPI000C76E21B|nr:ABC transporter permease subunit [Bacillus sp. M6-12]PLS17675.1 peptide ABC transporter permease [Bacillus sp. M6-12]
MMRLLWKDRAFVFSIGFLSLLLILSVLNSFFNDGEIWVTRLLIDEKTRDIIGSPPFPPSWNHPFGTDKNGYDMLHIIIQGSKYTIGFGLLITLLRISLSFLLGSFISAYTPRLIPIGKMIAEPFTIVPQTIIVYFLLVSVLFNDSFTSEFSHSLGARLGFQTAVMSLVSLPVLTSQFASLMKKQWDQEFIESSRVLGGSKFHILIKHIIPNMRDSAILLFLQQFIQVLGLMAHLGVLSLFLGGTKTQDMTSVTYEWSGQIGVAFRYLVGYPWIAMTPIIFFSLTILALSLILASVKKAFEREKA